MRIEFLHTWDQTLLCTAPKNPGDWRFAAPVGDLEIPKAWRFGGPVSYLGHVNLSGHHCTYIYYCLYRRRFYPPFGNKLPVSSHQPYLVRVGPGNTIAQMVTHPDANDAIFNVACDFSDSLATKDIAAPLR
ncbi:hypothetical protein M8J77_016092 [Diaphorina citri]|nr:hypothetical protein M8J77_016092 [Diaphorina citri]